MNELHYRKQSLYYNIPSRTVNSLFGLRSRIPSAMADSPGAGSTYGIRGILGGVREGSRGKGANGMRTLIDQEVGVRTGNVGALRIESPNVYSSIADPLTSIHILRKSKHYLGLVAQLRRSNFI